MKKGRVNNCVNCTVAMDMRQRGYDVIARSSGEGATLNDYKHWYKDVEFEYLLPDKRIGENRKAYTNRTFDGITNRLEDFGDGAGGCMLVVYESSFGACMGGHSIYWKVENGNVNFYDGQSKNVNPDRLFALSKIDECKWARLDNLEILPEITERVVSKRG